MGTGDVLGKVRQVREGGEGRGAGTDDSSALSCVTGTDGRALEVRHAVGDALGCRALAQGREAVAADGAGRGPGAGGVDDGANGEPLLRTVRKRDVNREGLLVAVGVDDAVAAEAGNTRDPSAVTNPVAEHVGERLEVLVSPVPARRIGGAVGCGPAGGGEELLGGRIDELGPGGEQPNVTPLAHRTGSTRTGFQNQGLDAALDEVGCGCQADGAYPRSPRWAGRRCARSR